MEVNNLSPVFGAFVRWPAEGGGPFVTIVSHRNVDERNGFATAVTMSNLFPSKVDFFDMPEWLNPEKRENSEVSEALCGRLEAAWKDYVSTPGHPTAKKHGCECPVIDNGHGKGVIRYGGELCFVVVGGCPLHGRVEFGA